MTDEEYFNIHRTSHINMNAEAMQERVERDKAIYQEALKELERIKIELTCEYRVIDDFAYNPVIDSNSNQVAKPDARVAITQKQFDYLLDKRVSEFEVMQIEKALQDDNERDLILRVNRYIV